MWQYQEPYGVYSKVFLGAILTFAHQKFAPHTFRVTIVSWNTRAQRMAQRAGFHHEQTFTNPNETEFVILTGQA
jgi:RimJ/RimL family protein N-acetyltransferase